MRPPIVATTACTRASNCVSARCTSLLLKKCQAARVRPMVSAPTAPIPARLNSAGSRPFERAGVGLAEGAYCHSVHLSPGPQRPATLAHARALAVAHGRIGADDPFQTDAGR